MAEMLAAEMLRCWGGMAEMLGRPPGAVLLGTKNKVLVYNSLV